MIAAIKRISLIIQRVKLGSNPTYLGYAFATLVWKVSQILYHYSDMNTILKQLAKLLLVEWSIISRNW